MGPGLRRDGALFHFRGAASGVTEQIHFIRAK
jgi:hypothetical protein